MAMNKKEIEHVRELMREVRLAKALRFTEEVKPDASSSDVQRAGERLAVLQLS